MDALTLLTLPPDTAVHVRTFMPRCPACVLRVAKMGNEKGGAMRAMLDQPEQVHVGASIEHGHRTRTCVDCPQELTYG